MQDELFGDYFADFWSLSAPHPHPPPRPLPPQLAKYAML